MEERQRQLLKDIPDWPLSKMAADCTWVLPLSALYLVQSSTHTHLHELSSNTHHSGRADVKDREGRDEREKRKDREGRDEREKGAKRED